MFLLFFFVCFYFGAQCFYNINVVLFNIFVEIDFFQDSFMNESINFLKIKILQTRMVEYIL